MNYLSPKLGKNISLDILKEDEQNEAYYHNKNKKKFP